MCAGRHAGPQQQLPLPEAGAPAAASRLGAGESSWPASWVVTAANLKAEIIDKMVSGKPIQTAAELCVDRYAEGCKKLGITK